MDITVKKFGTIDDVSFEEIFIQKKGQFMISFSNLGARINSWKVLDEHGTYKNVVLGFNDANHAMEGSGYYFGATVGRVAGRIAKGTFKLDNQQYHLSKNEGQHHLHGGENSFDVRKWDYILEEEKDQIKVIFNLTDRKKVNGYPGNLTIQVTHTITVDNEWIISYKAKSDERTLFNPTNHVSFNLNGDVEKGIENHIIELKSDYFLPLDSENLPLGVISSVEGTPFDLRRGNKFGDLLNSEDEQLNLHQGFDHPFILKRNADYHGSIRVPKNPYQLFFHTTEPVVVIYTQNYVSHNTKIWGQDLQRYSGLTLETQKEPDAINHPNFSSIILEENQIYTSQTKYWLEQTSKGDE